MIRRRVPSKGMVITLVCLMSVLIFCSLVSVAIANNKYADSFQYPVNLNDVIGSKKWQDKQNFGSLNNIGNPHLGEDWNWGSYDDDLGKPVYAIANGTVKYAGDYDPGKRDAWEGVIIIEHTAPAGKKFLTGTGEYVDKVRSMYAHLDASKINNWVRKGDTVDKGNQIGIIGHTPARSEAPHLHFEIRNDTSKGVGCGYSWNMNGWIDPSEFINNNINLEPTRSFSVFVHAYDSKDITGKNYFEISGSWTVGGANITPDLDLGYNGFIYYAATNTVGWVKWTPNIPKSGNYKILAFIPRQHATSEKAVYEIYHNGITEESKEIRQINSGKWVELGTYYFEPGMKGYVKLNSATGESGEEIAADAIKFEYVSAPPIASFTYSPQKPIVGEEVIFNASNSSDVDGGEIAYYSWEFYKLREYVPFPLIHIDEGPDKKIIKYSFHSEGTYQIHLTVTDDEGEVNSTDKYLEVKKTLFEPLDIVLVTDISGSMNREWKGEKKIDTVKKAAKTFLNLMDKTNDRVGLVSFAESATFDLYLTHDFDRAKNTINGYSGYGRTNIGDALTKAVNELKSLGRPEAAKAIVFLTDGNITTGMREYEVLTGPVEDAADNEITIYSLGYGGPSNLKEEFLTDVAENTGGKYYYVPSPEELENIYLELSGRVAGLTPLAVKKNQIHQDEIMSLPFFIDVTIDMFRAMLNWGGSDLDIGLKNPSGEYVVPGAKVRYSGPNTKPEWYELIHPEPGIWTAEIHGKDVPEDYENFTMQVMASTPITLSVRTDRATYDGGEPVLITAELKERVEPITGTHVFAKITMPDSSSETLKLYDDGSHGDINPGDGIYTNSFRKTYWVGLYEVKASAMDGFSRVDTTSIRILTPFTVTTPLELWSRTFGGKGEDYAEAVIQTSDDGYAIAGWTTSYSAGSTDAWLVKTDRYGNEEWNKTFGGYKRDAASSIIQTSDGGYVLAGHTESYGKGSDDFWLIKTDSYGDVIWSRVFGSRSSLDEATSIVQASDGGYVIAGIAAGNGDAWLVKTDRYGNELWNKTFGGHSLDSAESLIQTSDSGYAFAGFTLSCNAVGGDAWLVKTDRYGNEQWNKTFGAYNWEAASSIIQTSDGGYALAGCTCSYGKGSADFWVLKTNCYGNKEWSKTFGGDDWDEASSIIQTSDGSYAIAGWTTSYGTGSSDAWFMKIGCYGDEEWSKTLGGYNPDGVKSIIQKTDGYYIIAGWTRSYGAGSSDAWLIKLIPPGMMVQSGVDFGEDLRRVV